MAAHTAGSWGVEDPMDHCLTIIANPEAPTYDWVWVATCDWPDEDDHNITSAEVRANAYLLSAAPQLLALAENLQRWLGKDVEPSHVGAEDMRVYHLDGGVLSNLLNDARAAIAKATGQ